jgi:hypothetical protein
MDGIKQSARGSSSAAHGVMPSIGINKTEVVLDA